MNCDLRLKPKIKPRKREPQTLEEKWEAQEEVWRQRDRITMVLYGILGFVLMVIVVAGEIAS